MDTFRDKITKSPWSNYNPDWDPELNDYDLCLEDLKDLYEKIEFKPAVKVYPTCATDTEMIKAIMHLVFSSILASSLGASFQVWFSLIDFVLLVDEDRIFVTFLLIGRLDYGESMSGFLL